MKFGMRTPSIKRSVNPLYGKKGVGFVKSPKKSIYNKVYHKTTFSFWDCFKKLFK